MTRRGKIKRRTPCEAWITHKIQISMFPKLYKNTGTFVYGSSQTLTWVGRVQKLWQGFNGFIEPRGLYYLDLPVKDYRIGSAALCAHYGGTDEQLTRFMFKIKIKESKNEKSNLLKTKQTKPWKRAVKKKAVTCNSFLYFFW